VPRGRRLVLPFCMSGAALLMAACSGSVQPRPSHASTQRTALRGAHKIASTVADHLSAWALPNPLSRMVVLSDGSGRVMILGGLTAGDTSANGVFRLDLADGQLTAVSSLPDAVHDAAGAQLAGRDLVIGGGSTSTIAAVQAMATGGGPATVLAQLPEPRSDDSATMVGKTVVIAGGYDGAVADPAVLTTTTGTSFSVAGVLPVTVRYCALAAIGHDVYAFGGLAVSGPRAGLPVSDVQRIDLKNGSAAVVARLPQPLEGASAFVLGGRIFVAGGDTARGSTGALTSSGTIWAFHQAAPTGSVATSGRGARASAFSAAGTLSEAVSNAGVAVMGSTAWLIGGEHDGTPVTAIQQIQSTS